MLGKKSLLDKTAKQPDMWLTVGVSGVDNCYGYNHLQSNMYGAISRRPVFFYHGMHVSLGRLDYNNSHGKSRVRLRKGTVYGILTIKTKVPSGETVEATVDFDGSDGASTTTNLLKGCQELDRVAVWFDPPPDKVRGRYLFVGLLKHLWREFINVKQESNLSRCKEARALHKRTYGQLYLRVTTCLFNRWSIQPGYKQRRKLFRQVLCGFCNSVRFSLLGWKLTGTNANAYRESTIQQFVIWLYSHRSEQKRTNDIPQYYWLKSLYASEGVYCV